MRKQIFKAIADAVAAVPGVAFVDLWNNQVQTLNGGAAFAFAAVFIEFEAVEWKQQNMGARRGAPRRPAPCRYPCRAHTRPQGPAHK